MDKKQHLLNKFDHVVHIKIDQEKLLNNVDIEDLQCDKLENDPSKNKNKD
jgi:hypothetical protein